jgi:hypothetical protein
MARAVLFTLAILICGQAILICGQAIFAQPLSIQQLLRKSAKSESYWQTRQRLLLNEQRQSLGGKLELNPIEVRANEVLMRAKNQEIHDGLILSLTIA